MNFETNKETDRYLGELQRTFGVYDNAAVLEKLIALGLVVQRHTDDRGHIRLANSAGEVVAQFALGG
jgi:hypothetical protein